MEKFNNTVPEPKIINGKTFKLDEKSLADHQKLGGKLSTKEDVLKFLDNETLLAHTANSLSFKEGAIITVELEVRDSLFSGLLLDAMYGTSDFDKKPLRLFGMEIKTIHFRGATVFTEQEQYTLREAAKILKKLEPNEENK